jgi:mRNA-degrading endonuclease HigB of HigAB toxin-antitoxin module
VAQNFDYPFFFRPAASFVHLKTPNNTEIFTNHVFRLPDQMKTGFYTLNVSASKFDDQHIIFNPEAGDTASTLPIGPLLFPPKVSTEDIQAAIPLGYTFYEDNQSITQLTGYDLKKPSHLDKRIHLALNWLAKSKGAGDYKVFVHLRDIDDNIIVQVDRILHDTRNMSNPWQEATYLHDVFALEPPDNIPAGLYYLYVGLYDTQTERRLIIVDQNDHSILNNEIQLTHIVHR